MLRPRSAERLLAIFAAAMCVFFTLFLWQNVSAYQGTWPFPALYFIEVMVLGMLSLTAILGSYPFRAQVAWASAGALMAFSILGAWSVGMFYLPAAVAFLAAALIADVREKRTIAAHGAVFVVAGLAQAAMMLEVARLL